MNTPFTVAVRDDYVTAEPGETFFDGLRALGLNHFELQVNSDYSLPNLFGDKAWSLKNASDTAALKERLDAEGVAVVALILGTDFCGPDAQQHIQWAIDIGHRARELGVSTIRLDPLTASGDLPIAGIQDKLVSALKEILAGTQDVEFGLENHGIVGNDARFLNAIFDAVDDPRLGMTLDIANFYWSGMPLSELYETLEHFAPRAKHTHVKSIAYPAEIRETRREVGHMYGEYASPLDEGDIDLKVVVKLLRDANYQGALCIENESLPRFSLAQRPEILRRDAAAVREALAA